MLIHLSIWIDAMAMGDIAYVRQMIDINMKGQMSMIVMIMKRSLENWKPGLIWIYLQIDVLSLEHIQNRDLVLGSNDSHDHYCNGSEIQKLPS